MLPGTNSIALPFDIKTTHNPQSQNSLSLRAMLWQSPVAPGAQLLLSGDNKILFLFSYKSYASQPRFYRFGALG